MLKIVPGVLFALVLAVAAPPPARAYVGRGEIERWRKDLAEIDRALRGAEWAGAEKDAQALVDRMVRDAPGMTATKLLSVALLSLALAEAGLGETDDALWHWSAAQNFNPALREARLPAYGEPGALLERHRLREPGAPPPDLSPLSPVALGPGVTPPEHDAEDVVLQEWARFELVVAADGSVHAPVVLVQGRSKATLEALETFRTLEMGPAKVDGEPVAVYWRPRPKVWVIHGGNDPIESAVASCTELGAVMETSGVGTGPYSPFMGGEPGLIKTLRKKALHREADTLVIDAQDHLNIKGRIFRCGPDWIPPRLRAGDEPGA